MKQGYNISLSIVTFNSSYDIRNVLDSVYSSNCVGRLTVYVIDNNSSDDTIDIIEKEFPLVRLIKSKKNLGFGAGHNKAIEIIDSKYHIMVNPDVSFNPEVIDQLSDYMDENEDVVITTPKIINYDKTEQFLPKKHPKIKYFLGGRFEGNGGIFKKWRDEYTLKNENIVVPIQINFCTGCFMFTRTSALKKCNGFDERYFLHFEDADLTREMQSYGRTVYNPNINVNHRWQRDNVKNRKIFFIALKSMCMYFFKWSFKFRVSRINNVKLVGVENEQPKKR